MYLEVRRLFEMVILLGSSRSATQAEIIALRYEVAVRRRQAKRALSEPSDRVLLGKVKPH